MDICTEKLFRSHCGFDEGLFFVSVIVWMRLTVSLVVFELIDINNNRWFKGFLILLGS